MMSLLLSFHYFNPSYVTTGARTPVTFDLFFQSTM